MKIIFHLLNGDKIKNIHYLYGVDKKTIRSILIVIISLISDYNKSIMMKGEKVILEIDESKFGKRKYNKGHRVEGSWILRGVERSNERKNFLERAEQRNANTLESVVKNRIRLDPIIYTDSWRGYSNLSSFYTHLAVNHSRNFVDPTTGVHTNSIEGTWNSVKIFVKKRYFSSKYLDFYLAIFVFMRNEGERAYKTLIKFFI